MKENILLDYFANIRFPTEKAHGIQIAKMCEALAPRCSTLRLIVPERKNPKITESAFSYYKLRKNFTVIKVPIFDPTFLFSFSGGLYIKAETIIFIFALKKFFRMDANKGTHAFCRDETLLPALLKEYSHVVWEAHNIPRRKKWYVPFWKRCKKIIAISAGIKNELARVGVDPEKIIIARDAVDLGLFSPSVSKKEARKQLGVPLEKKIVLYAGHLYPWKGSGTLVRAANEFSKTDNALFYLVGGDVEELKDPEISRLCLENENIRIIPSRPHTEIPVWLATADILVLPNTASSKISKEFTSPLKLFEYMASRRPILASDIPSIREVLNESNAFLVEPDNFVSLANAIRQILKEGDNTNMLTEQAFSDVRTHTWENRAEKILALL